MKCGLFSDFQYVFRSFQSTTDLLTVVIELLTILTGLGKLELLMYPRLLTGFRMQFFLTNLTLMEFQVRYLALFLDRKYSQEYSVNAGVPQDSILDPTPFLLYINDLPDDVFCNVAIYADDPTLYSMCDHASDLCGNN